MHWLSIPVTIPNIRLCMAAGDAQLAISYRADQPALQLSA